MSTLPIGDKATIVDLATAYDVSPKVFRNWLKPLADEIGEKVGRYFTPRQVEIMKRHFGLPSSLNESSEAISPPVTESREDEQQVAEEKPQPSTSSTWKKNSRRARRA